VQPGKVPGLPAGIIAAPKVFDLSLTDEQGQSRGPYSSTKPITITVLRSAGEMALANSVEPNQVIQHCHHGSCKLLPTTVDFASYSVTLDWSPDGTRIACEDNGDMPKPHLIPEHWIRLPYLPR